MDTTDWQGPAGANWARDWRRTDRSFAGLDGPLLAAILVAAPDTLGRIVDIGCGAGATSLALAEARRDAELIGVDVAAGLIEVANSRAHDSPNAGFRHGDAVALAAGLAPVDLFVSRHGVMFFDDPVAAFSAFADAAAPDAAMVFSCFADREANLWATETAGAVGAVSLGGPGPFAFADPAHVAAILAAANWRADAPRRVAYSYIAGAGADPVADAVDFFTRIGPAAATIRNAPEGDRAMLLDRLTQVCQSRLANEQVAFPATAWIWTARRQESRA